MERYNYGFLYDLDYETERRRKCDTDDNSSQFNKK